MRAIPPVIKEEIFRKYLKGDSTTEISKLYDVSVGTVSAITTEESNKDNDFFQIREITKTFKKHNLKISDIISGIRLYNKIKKLGVDIVFFEKFIESIDTESFRLKKNIDKFLEDIKRIVHFEDTLRIKIGDLPGYMGKTLKQCKSLKEENIRISKENVGLYSKYNIEKSELEEYIKEKPLFLQYKRDKATIPKNPEWIVNEPLFKEVSKKIGLKIDPQILYKKLKWLYILPDKHPTIIKKIMTTDIELLK